jgi:transposase InsO family protein
MGEARPEAVKWAAGLTHLDPRGWERKVSRRSIYRWLKAYGNMGLNGLRSKRRARQKISVVLDEDLLDYFAREKRGDPAASIPELIKRAVLKGLIPHRGAVKRGTVWRALRRMGVETKRGDAPKKGRCRRFAYAHRLDMVLCDGKHFRAGASRAKRVALFFLDDATRMMLTAVVGTSESAGLFLQGLAACVTHYGRMRAIYLDRGSAFVAGDSLAVLAKLGIHVIHGRPRYPEGHGKIERFHRRIWDALLRRLAGNPEIDASPVHLTLRLRHYIRKIYNHEPHESLGGQTPWSCFHADPVPLQHYEDEQAVREHFVLEYGRRVSNDHVVTLRGTAYELPLSVTEKRVVLYRNVLEETVSINHQGRAIPLAPLDLLANARRAPHLAGHQDSSPPTIANLPTSAEMAFERDFPSLVDEDGNCYETRRTP